MLGKITVTVIDHTILDISFEFAKEILDKAEAAPITYRDTSWICTCGAGCDKEAPDHAESCAVYCPF